MRMQDQRKHQSPRIMLLCLLILLAGCAPVSDKPTPDQAKQFLKLRGYNLDEKSFFEAAAASDTMAVSAFLSAGINPNAKDAVRGETALITAAVRGDLPVVKALLQGGADVNTKSEAGATALLRALEDQKYAVADTLVADQKLDLNAQAGNGSTALIYYVTADREDIVSKLLERGANVNLQDREGDTALHRAASHGNERILKMLLAKGANPNIKNKLGGTALMWAAAFGQDRSVTVLLDNGADPRLKDEDGITASGWAAKNKNEELAKLLREAERRK